MPDQNKMMFVRPRNCRYCGHGFFALQHVLRYAQQHGFNTIDLAEEQANKIPIYEAIDQHDPGSFFGFGHGSPAIYTGDAEEPIFTTEECDRLATRVVYLLSCLTGQLLGPEIIKQGALAYAGFNISWTWMSDSGTDGDPYEDIYALCFWESANELWMALLDGAIFEDAVKASVAKYDEWIDYWFYDNPEDPLSQEAIKWLIHDRNGLVSLNICDVIADETECMNLGCHWQENKCYSQLPRKELGINWALAIPIILVVGLAFIAVKK